MINFETYSKPLTFESIIFCQSAKDNSLKAPAEGGQTEFCNMLMAYADLDAASKAELDEVSRELGRDPQVHIEVVGHADTAGEADYNAWLAERRANRVRSYLMDAGIDGERIRIRSEGDAVPIGPNSNPDGRALNRRAEILLER